MPMRETTYQAYTFLVFLYAGVVCAVAYDVISPVTRVLSALHALASVLYFAISVFIFEVAFYITNCNQLRLYMPIAFLCGAILYQAGIRSAFVHLIKFLRTDRKKADDGE